MPILYDLMSEPSLKTSILKAGMLTTTRVSFGTEFGTVGSVSALAAVVLSLFSGPSIQ